MRGAAAPLPNPTHRHRHRHRLDETGERNDKFRRVRPENEQLPQGFGKARTSVLRVGLVLIAVIAAGCGEASGPGGSSQALFCSDVCPSRGDGECDDGGANSAYFVCRYGEDCSDCGPRDPGQVPNCCLRYQFFEDESACFDGTIGCPQGDTTAG
jgi:hypothetical protein